MNTQKELEKKIDEMRQALYEKINNKENLLDIEVVNASHKLDLALNQYNQLFKN